MVLIFKPRCSFYSMNFYELAKGDMDDVEKQIGKYLGGREETVYGLLLPFIKRGGKRMRPLLALLCFRAFGGKSTGTVMRVASLIEMFHNFTLIHDDIEDSSKFRRGEPTLHITYGIPVALNAGDALYTLVWEELSKVEKDNRKETDIMRLCSDSFSEVVEGQGVELFWEYKKKFNITESNYFEMIEKKTAALIGLSCRIGAYLAGASKKEQDIIEKFGREVGIAFQIHDDILNVTGDFEKYKKEIGGDITEGKRTLMIVKALEKSSPADRATIMRVLSTHSEKEEDLRAVIAILHKYDSIEYARQQSRKLIARAKLKLKPLKPSVYKDALLEMSDYIITREA
jgi:geranylgeranyl diphosphate synthase type I